MLWKWNHCSVLLVQRVLWIVLPDLEGEQRGEAHPGQVGGEQPCSCGIDTAKAMYSSHDGAPQCCNLNWGPFEIVVVEEEGSPGPVESQLPAEPGKGGCSRPTKAAPIPPHHVRSVSHAAVQARPHGAKHPVGRTPPRLLEILEPCFHLFPSYKTSCYSTNIWQNNCQCWFDIFWHVFQFQRSSVSCMSLEPWRL